MVTMEKPIENCYWVVPGRLLAGEYPRNKDSESSQEKINSLLRSGVKAFVDLTEENEGLMPYANLILEAYHYRFPIRDVSTPESEGFTQAILDTIDHHMSKGELVYIHCWGGVGRTGVIVGCWLAQQGISGKVALTQLREMWQQCPKSVFRQSPETAQQEHYILEWKAEL
jgi:protein-tyrosine phosphatase